MVLRFHSDNSIPTTPSRDKINALKRHPWVIRRLRLSIEAQDPWIYARIPISVSTGGQIHRFFPGEAHAEFLAASLRDRRKRSRLTFCHQRIYLSSNLSCINFIVGAESRSASSNATHARLPPKRRDRPFSSPLSPPRSVRSAASTSLTQYFFFLALLARGVTFWWDIESEREEKDGKKTTASRSRRRERQMAEMAVEVESTLQGLPTARSWRSRSPSRRPWRRSFNLSIPRAFVGDPEGTRVTQSCRFARKRGWEREIRRWEGRNLENDITVPAADVSVVAW